MAHHRAHHRNADIRQFKGVTVYDWESEPADERPTVFGASTGFDGQSSLFDASTLERRRRARRRSRRRGGLALWLPVVMVLGLSSALLYAAARVLHH